MSTTQMIDLNQRILDQTNQIKAITRVAQAANDTSGNIMRELGHQRGQIQRNIDVVWRSVKFIVSRLVRNSSILIKLRTKCIPELYVLKYGCGLRRLCCLGR